MARMNWQRSRKHGLPLPGDVRQLVAVARDQDRPIRGHRVVGDRSWGQDAQVLRFKDGHVFAIRTDQDDVRPPFVFVASDGHMARLVSTRTGLPLGGPLPRRTAIALARALNPTVTP